MEPTLVVTGTLMVTIVGAVWSLALWITRQFSAVKTLIYDKFEQSLDRLESHEKHDNARFAEVNNRLWELRVDHASLYSRRDRVDKENEETHSRISRPKDTG